MRRSLLAAMFALLAWCGSARTESQTPFPPSLVDVKGSFIVAGQIGGLAWGAKKAVENPLLAAGQRVIHLTLQGEFVRPNWRLVHETGTVPISTDGSFTIEHDLSVGQVSFEVLAVGPEGEVELQTVGFIREATPEGVEPPSPEDQDDFPTHKRFSVTLAEENTALSQASLRGFNLNNLFVGLDGAHAILGNAFEVGGAVQGSVANISNPLPGIETHFLDANVYIGRKWRWDRFELVPCVRGLYSTMFVTNDAFGYQNLSGEGLALIGRWYPSRSYAFSAWLGYSYLNSSLAIGNRELGGRARFIYRWTKNDELGFEAGYDGLAFSTSGNSLNRGSGIFQLSYSRVY